MPISMFQHLTFRRFGTAMESGGPSTLVSVEDAVPPSEHIFGESMQQDINRSMRSLPLLDLNLLSSMDYEI
jgi:hypothetical protein